MSDTEKIDELMSRLELSEDSHEKIKTIVTAFKESEDELIRKIKDMTQHLDRLQQLKDEK